MQFRVLRRILTLFKVLKKTFLLCAKSKKLNMQVPIIAEKREITENCLIAATAKKKLEHAKQLNDFLIPQNSKKKLSQ
jgi:hypothetical protein